MAYGTLRDEGKPGRGPASGAASETVSCDRSSRAPREDERLFRASEGTPPSEADGRRDGAVIVGG